MKKIEIETSKGRFVIVDGVGEDFAMDLTHMIISDEWFVNLSEITEEQASEIVDECKDFFDGELGYINYQVDSLMFNNPIKSLHSLLKSKGIHLFENPDDNQCGTIEWQEAEQKTFYNPYIFKL